jgi:A/G-specific adenine glycosylase
MPKPERRAVRPFLLHRRILTWYEAHRRELQWRTTADPYEILVSEVMLQQTQVRRVKAKLPAFLRRFPSLRALAAASNADVVRAWSGMGYNNRAIRLREFARAVIERHGGTIPRDAAALMDLPGVGRYTAHALLSFAFRRDVPVVDVNIRRVLSRVFQPQAKLESTVPEKEAWDLAAAVLPSAPYDWNQALMDLGATICTARRPLCARCPVRAHCASGDLLASARPARAAVRRAPEPSHAGVPQRIWRGKAVEALRSIDHEASISVDDLGRLVKPGYRPGDRKWLLSILAALADDGIVETKRKTSQVFVRLAS